MACGMPPATRTAEHSRNLHVNMSVVLTLLGPRLPDLQMSMVWRKPFLGASGCSPPCNVDFGDSPPRQVSRGSLGWGRKPIDTAMNKNKFTLVE